jgi:hypothetical protein
MYFSPFFLLLHSLNAIYFLRNQFPEETVSKNLFGIFTLIKGMLSVTPCTRVVGYQHFRRLMV